MKVEFEKQFGQGVDPWHEKAKRWAKNKSFPFFFSFRTHRVLKENLDQCQNQK